MKKSSMMICSLFVFLHWLLEEQNNISSSRSSVDVGDDDLFSHTVCMEQGGVTMLRAVAKAKYTHTLTLRKHMERQNSMELVSDGER